jgi:hypothetical protein
MVVANWLPHGKVEPISHMDSTIAVLMNGRSYPAIVLSMGLTGSTFLGGSQLTTTIH